MDDFELGRFGDGWDSGFRLICGDDILASGAGGARRFEGRRSAMEKLNQLSRLQVSSMNWRKRVYLSYAAARGYRFPSYLSEYADEWESGRAAETAATALNRLLGHCWHSVPYYAELLEGAGYNPSASSEPWETLLRLPVLRKDTIRANFPRLRSVDLPTRKWSYNTSGGSTGEPIDLIQDSEYEDRAIAHVSGNLAEVDVLDIDVVQAKAALAQLNQANALSELEEAWLCRSLYREDKLTQPQIGRLLRRHKAWVCRRLALAEGLDETVEADVRLGLVAARAAYEVTRLPRGNQREVAELVMRRGLTVGQTARLCTALLACGDPAARRVLLCEAQEGTGAPPARAARRQRSPGEKLVDDVSAVTQLLARLQARLCATPLSSLGEAAAAQVTSALIALEPALVALSGTIAKVRGGRHAHLA